MNLEIQNKIKDSHYHKFQGVAPEGFMLIPHEVLERLRDFDTWKDWRNKPELIDEMIKEFCTTELI